MYCGKTVRKEYVHQLRGWFTSNILTHMIEYLNINAPVTLVDEVVRGDPRRLYSEAQSRTSHLGERTSPNEL